MVLFKDTSYAQGEYDMGSNTDPAVMMKMSGFYTGSKQPYYDVQAARNYQNAVVAGKVPMMYHFAGGGDPIAEADWFVKACSPLAQGDLLALDWEIEHDDAEGWIRAFAEHVHATTGVWPWIYMDMDRANRYNMPDVWANCGYWCAAPSFGFDDTLPVKIPQIAQQGPIENGVDTDAFFGDLDQLKKYGYQGGAQPAPTPVLVPEPTPVPTPDPQPTPGPVPDPEPSPQPTPTPAPDNRLKALIVAAVAAIAAVIGGIISWLHSN